MNETCRIMLPDGRRLGFADLGHPAGRPVIYFHGFPGSRLEAKLALEAATGRDIRFIAPDRPGFGASDPKPGRKLLDWPDDVRALADSLGLERFRVLGASGGGPFALACARALPGRIVVAGVASGLGPLDDPALLDGMIWFNRIGLRVARRAPWVAPLVFGPLAPLVRTRGEWLITRLASRARPPDRRFFESATHVRAFTETMREAFRQGGDGATADGRIYGRPWGFRLEDVETPVLLWHGERDPIVPVAFGRYVAERLPRCRASFYPEDGHFSLAVDRVATLLAELVDDDAAWGGADR